MATAKKSKGKSAKRAAQKPVARKGASPRAKSVPPRAQSAVALAELTAFDDLGTDELGGTSLAAEDRQLLAKVARFLTAVVQQRVLRRAVGAGYSKSEHEELWSLFLAAAGRDQPLAFAFAAFDGGGGSERSAILAELDAFENEWFPKTRAIIERRVPAALVERFAQSFFKDLQQQPLGPLVLDSVVTFLERVEALATSDEAGAIDVYESLRARGLSDAKIAATRALAARALSGSPAEPAKVDPEAWKTSQEQQAESLRRLRLAWNDWATTLRPLFDVRQQIQLGLTEVKLRAEEPPPAGPDLTLTPAA